MDSLEILIATEFPSFKINYDEHDGSHSFLITPVADELETLVSTGQNRSYGVLISYRVSGSKMSKNGVFKSLTAVSERLKRLVDNNVGYSPSGSYKWHNARIESIEYIKDEDTYFYANMLFNCESMEAR